MQILNIANNARFSDLAPSQIIPILAEEGLYIASESTLYRLLRKENQLTHRNKCQPRQHRRPKTLIATKSNQVWSWDITYLPSCIRGLFFYLYLIIDVYSRKIVGFEVSDLETAEIASECIERSCGEETITKNELSLHSDNGSPMKGYTLLATLQKLGVMPTYNRPGVSNDNAYSESLFKTMKYHCSCPNEPFENINAAKEWVKFFVTWYHYEHIHSALKFVTPHQKHTGEDKRLLTARTKTYELARKSNPMRWSKGIRNWTPIKMTLLNPNSKIKKMLESLNEEEFIQKMRQ